MGEGLGGWGGGWLFWVDVMNGSGLREECYDG